MSESHQVCSTFCAGKKKERKKKRKRERGRETGRELERDRETSLSNVHLFLLTQQENHTSTHPSSPAADLKLHGGETPQGIQSSPSPAIEQSYYRTSTIVRLYRQAHLT
jgi:hypothetical protein